jgi:DNA-binding transcriptional ArsR family regulator
VDTYRDADGWSILGDSTRRSIVECLARRPRAVGELAAELPVSRPAVSQHLKVLKDAGLVAEEAEGTRRIYRLNPIAVLALRDQLDAFWGRALTGYAELAERAGDDAGDEHAISDAPAPPDPDPHSQQHQHQHQHHEGDDRD